MALLNWRDQRQLWPKRKEFIDWADKVFRIAKKQ